MLFVPSDKLKVGMRLAKPIFNRNGVLLYDRDSKLTSQGIQSVKNFRLIGIYILEPAEPLPPMSDEEREFERFQTMSVFTLQDVLERMRGGMDAEDALKHLAEDIVRQFGKTHGKLTFMQNLRSPEDTVFKHSLNTAILAAAIYPRLNAQGGNRARNTVMAALLHDIGSLDVPEAVMKKGSAELTEEDYELMDSAREAGYHMIHERFHFDSEVTKDFAKLIEAIKEMRTTGFGEQKDVDFQVETLKVAYVFDQMTAMKYGEDPQSVIAAYKYLHHPGHRMNQQVVSALAEAVHIVPAGCSVELSNGSTGIVLTENPDDILRPFVLSFRDNKVYNLADGKVYQEMQIKDVQKTMDNRYVMSDDYKKYLNGLPLPATE